MNRKLPPPNPGRPAPDASSPNRSMTLIILGAVAAIIAVVVVMAFVLASGDDDDTLGEAAATSAPAAVDTSAETTASAGSATSGAAAEVGPAAPAGPIDPLAPSVTVSGDALVPAVVEGPADEAVGQPAPALVGTDYEGAPVEITPGADGPMLVVFLAHWCPHCNAEIPVLNEWRDAGGIPDELRVVGVSTAVTNERPNYPPGEWLDEMDWQWDVLADGPVNMSTGGSPAADAYGVTGYPFFVLVDADGNVAARGSGEKPIEELEALVATATDA